VRVLPAGDDHPASPNVLRQLAGEIRARQHALRARLTALRQAYTAWGDLYSYVRTAREPLVAICGYCSRLRTKDGVWRIPPKRLSAYLRRRQALSHGCCNDCLSAQGFDEASERCISSIARPSTGP
jgi:hypothetical protein